MHKSGINRIFSFEMHGHINYHKDSIITSVESNTKLERFEIFEIEPNEMPLTWNIFWLHAESERELRSVKQTLRYE